MEQPRQTLEVGSKALGLDLSAAQLDQLLGHLELLAKWNPKRNLVAEGSPESWARRHTLDSLAPGRWVHPSLSVIDLGSGAGFPGIPLAIAFPNASFRLVDTRVARVGFLQNVIAALHLTNATAHVPRGGDAPADLVVGRAVAQPAAYAGLAGDRCAPGGRFVLFARGQPPAELSGARLEDAFAYRVDGEPERVVGLYVPRGTTKTS